MKTTLLTSQYFAAYLHEALERYRDDTAFEISPEDSEVMMDEDVMGLLRNNE